MNAYPTPPPPSFLPIPHTAPTYPINLPPVPPMDVRLQHHHRAHQPHVPQYSQQGRNARRESIGHPVGLNQGREGGGLGLMGQSKLGHFQAPFAALPRLPPSMPLERSINFGLPSPAPISVPSPRPHPHLTSTDLYISNVPRDLPEAAIADALRDCCPVRINLSVPIRHADRLKPDDYYDWMPRAGTLHFTHLHSAEKALVILIGHPSLAHAGLVVSIYPPPTSPLQLPHVLPFPDPTVPARYLRPTQHITPPQSHNSKDPIVALSSQVPSLGVLFDIVRPWGSLRQITVWLEDSQLPLSGQSQPALSWGARVLFWFEDEARRFEVGFGSTGFLIKGWQIRIFAEQPAAENPIHTTLPSPFTQSSPQFSPSTVNPPIQLGDHGNNIDPEIFRRMGMPIFPTTPPVQSPHHPFHPHQPFHAPLSPPIDFNPPWSNHNIFAGPIRPPNKAAPGYDRRMSVPTGSNNVQLGSRRSLGNVHNHGQIKEALLAKQKTWSIQLESSVEGELMPTGIRSSEGEFIHHGPGQHIRPAPLSGPGSGSASGLVDYSNVYVKNLDSDICSFFLEDLFSNLGRIVSAKVMRDDEGRSRGYGFVSFYSPKEAAHAITVMNNTRVGSQQIAVTLHEPKKLRPEKQAERLGSMSGNTSRRGSTVGIRQESPMSARRGSQLGPLALGSLVSARFDDLRPLSPESQKHALSRQGTGPTSSPQVIDGSGEKPPSSTEDLHIGAIPVESKITESYPDSTSFPPSPTATARSSISLTEAESHTAISAEIAKIDLENAPAIMEIMWPLLHPFERQRALESRGFLAVRYGIAKRELLRQQGGTLGSPTSTSSPSPLTATQSSTSTIDTSTSSSQINLIPLDEITLDTLASRSASDIMAHLSSSVGTLILDKLGMRRPTSEEAGQLARWILNVREKEVLERDAEICAVIAGYFQSTWGKRFIHLKVARELVRDEDIGALCKLIAYPKLLDAKARLYHENEMI